MGNVSKGFRAFLEAVPTTVRSLANLPAMLAVFVAGLRAICRGGVLRVRCKEAFPIGPLRRPDPMLYSQQYLMQAGLAVTWDNPDIQLFRDGVAVPSSALEPGTDYEVQVRVWNNSMDAPAIGLPVALSYLSFGIGTVSTAVGQAVVDLGAKGSSTCPAYARIKWRTPAEPGHYCLQARLLWSDDANPDNNMGQENTQVGELHSPAEYRFRVRNPASVARRVRFEADMYRLRPRPPCRGEKRRWESRMAESEARWKAARAEHGRGVAPVSAGWSVKIDPPELELGPLGEVDVAVSIEPREPFVGEEVFNINGWALDPDGIERALGGVTLRVVGGGS